MLQNPWSDVDCEECGGGVQEYVESVHLFISVMKTLICGAVGNIFGGELNVKNVVVVTKNT